LHLIKRRESLLEPLAAALAKAAEAVRPCPICGNLDTIRPCAICRDPKRDETAICVVEDLADLWALERTGAFRGRYHVLGGTLSALDGVGPEEPFDVELLGRLRPGQEMILALNATVEGKPLLTTSPTASPAAGSGCRGWLKGYRSAVSSTTSTTAL
jgi:recombination protein RecR